MGNIQRFLFSDIWKKSSSKITVHLVMYYVHVSYNYYSQPILKSGMDNPDQVFSCWPNLRKIFFTCGRFILYVQ